MKRPVKIAGVIGWPIAHSLSPAIHRIWMERDGIEGVYLPIAVEAGRTALAAGLGALRSAGFSGLNVTLPHKEDALALSARASDVARRVGAANMLTFCDGGIYGDNSDAEGFATAVEPHLAEDFAALVLGAGGAARAIVCALLDLAAAKRPRIAVANRTRARADALGAAFGIEVLPWERRSDALAAFDLLVNATSLGRTGSAALDIDLRGLPSGAIVADIVYAPLETPLLEAARARGLKTVDGLEMLMRQAARGYETWFGSAAQVDADLRARIEAEIARRTP